MWRARWLLPKVPHWRASFKLDVFRAHLYEALVDSGKYGFEKIDWRILEHRGRWSALQREYAAECIEDLRSAVREIEADRAAEEVAQ